MLVVHTVVHIFFVCEVRRKGSIVFPCHFCLRGAECRERGEKASLPFARCRERQYFVYLSRHGIGSNLCI